MIGYIIIVTLTGIITGVSMTTILGADGFLEKILAFIGGFITHLVLTLLLTASVYKIVEVFGGKL